MAIADWLNTLALAHGFCGVLLTLSSIFGDPDFVLLILDVFCSVGSILWLQHIETFGGSFQAKAMFVIIAISTMCGAAAVMAKRRYLPPKKEDEDEDWVENDDEAEGSDGSLADQLPDGMNGFELMAHVMGGGPALKNRHGGKSTAVRSDNRGRGKRSRR